MTHLTGTGSGPCWLPGVGGAELGGACWLAASGSRFTRNPWELPKRFGVRECSVCLVDQNMSIAMAINSNNKMKFFLPAVLVCAIQGFSPCIRHDFRTSIPPILASCAMPPYCRRAPSKATISITATNVIGAPLERRRAPTMAATSTTAANAIGAPLQLLRAPALVTAVWDFTRPHTIVGSGVSVLAIFLFATPPHVWLSSLFQRQLVLALMPALLMNMYITGLNQLTDVDIDKVNKPYLPIASGSLRQRDGTVIVALSLVGALLFAQRSTSWPLRLVLLGSGFLGTLYSMPPFRLKRFPLAAAVCILVVRGSLVNLGFFLHAKYAILGADIGRMTLWQACCKFPESVALAVFFAIFGVVIAIMKDVPDIRGDRMFSIPSFSVKLGARKMFDAASSLLTALLTSSSIACAASALQPSLLLGALSARLGVAAAFAGLAFDAHLRAQRVDPEEPLQIFSHYMHVWKTFYVCYALLPLASFAKVF